MNYKDYLREELLEMFFQLTNKKNATSLNLEENKIVEESFKFLFDDLEKMNIKEIMSLFKSIYKLNYKSKEVYEKFRNIVMSKIYSFEMAKIPNDFAFFILKIDEKVGFNQEETELLLDQIPRYLKEMNGTSVINLFELMLEKEYIQDPLDYLFEYHFFMYFWKKITNFSLHEMTRIIIGLKKMDYLKQDNEYILDDLLPALFDAVKTVNKSEDVEEALIEVENLVDDGIDHLDLSYVKEEFKKRINFIDKKLKLINESNIINMVKTDIQEFRKIYKKNREKNENENQFEGKN